MSRTILLTRPRADSEALAKRLAEAGWTTMIAPLLDIVDERPSLPDLRIYDALVFTSRHGIRAFAALTQDRDLPVYVVGEATFATARATGFRDVRQGPGEAAGLQAMLPRGRLLHPCGDAVRVAVGEALQVYRAVPASTLVPDVAVALRARTLDSIMLFSPRSGRIFSELAGTESGLALGAVNVLCLSGAVLKSVRHLGWRGAFVAARPDMPAMLDLVGRPGTKE